MADTGLLPAYLMNGSDELKRAFVVDRLKKRIGKLGDLDFNIDVFTAGAVEPGQVTGACNTLPFASELRLVVVKDVDKLSKALAEEIVTYLQDPNVTTVLALTATKLAKNTRLYKAVAKVGPKSVVDCSPKGKKELPAQVRDFGASMGVTVTQEAAERLIALVGESTVRLDTELRKIVTALGRGAVVGTADVDRYVVRTSEVKPWEFTDALCARDARQALSLLAQMDALSPFGLLTMSLNRLRELLVAQDLGSGGTRALAAELGVPDWRLKNHMRWARGFARGELERSIVAAADLERAMKSGGDARALFEQWTCRVCGK